MSFAEAFAPAEAHYRNQVINSTFGHLAPEPRKLYHGTLTFTYTAWKQLEPIDAAFDGLEMSPWLYQHIQDYMHWLAGIGKPGQPMRQRKRERIRAGHVYRWEGVYYMLKNGEQGRFRGTLTKLL